jgi:hypothetical protein
MGSLLRPKKASVEQYEASTVLAQGCRQLAQTCMTRGARRILQRMANQFERQAREIQGFGQPAVCVAKATQPRAVRRIT